MITGQIEQAKASKSGKTLGLLVNGEWYSTKDFVWQGSVGKTISFDVGTSELPNGGSMRWANDITLTGAATAPSPQAQAMGVQQQPAPNPAPRVVTVDREVEPAQCLPMTSNVVAHAIAAGVIKNPDDVAPWAQAAFTAARKLLSGESLTGASPVHTEANPPPFDDDIPF